MEVQYPDKERGERIMKISKAQFWLGLVCIILGLMISLQFKFVNTSKASPSSRRVEDLVKEVANLKTQRDDLLKRIGDAEKKLDDMEKQSANSNTTTASLKDEVDRLRKLAGTTEVKGDGILITINATTDLEANWVTDIRDYEIVYLVNELNSAHAEAVAINGERYTSRTSIRSAGSAIKINGNPYDPYKAFKIYAIGNADNLENALTITGGIVDQLKEQGVNVKISREKDIVISGSKTIFEFKYIK